MSKIMICGLNGSGKTTLGKSLAMVLNYRHLDVEDYYFPNEDNYKYKTALTTEKVTKKIEEDFNKYNNIVFTACKGDYGNISSKYDVVIYIHLDRETRLKRVKQRSYNQFGSRIFKNGDLFEKESKFFNMVYNRDELDIINWFNKLECYKIEIDGSKSIDENIKIILMQLKDFDRRL